MAFTARNAVELLHAAYRLTPALFKDGAYHILLDEQKSEHWLYLQ
jgi:hypothetical protein